MASKKNAHYAALDGLKGLAACIVAFGWHFQHFYTDVNHAPTISLSLPFSFELGYLMVELFFMLSGFGLFCGYAERLQSRAMSFRDFMARRLRKLYPLFIISTLLVVVLEWLHISMTGETFVYPNFDIYHFVLNVLLLQDGYFGIEYSFNSPSWFLSISVMMYVVFFLVCRSARSREQVYAAYTGLALAGCVIVISHVCLPLLNEFTGRGLACFSIGVLLSYPCLRAMPAPGTSPDQGIETGGLRWLPYAGLAILAALYATYRFCGLAPFGDVRMVFILCAAPLAIYCAVSIPWLGRALGCTPLRYLGSLSFGIYLLHFPVQCAIRDVDLWLGLGFNSAKMVCWILYIALVLAAAVAYRHFVEPRVSRLLARHRTSRT